MGLGAEMSYHATGWRPCLWPIATDGQAHIRPDRPRTLEQRMLSTSRVVLALVVVSVIGACAPKPEPVYVAPIEPEPVYTGKYK
jgi:hypothetical protein